MVRTTSPELEIPLRSPLSSLESTFYSILAEDDANIFTIRDIVNRLGRSYDGAKMMANRLVRKGWAIRLAGGRYLVVPFEAGASAEYSEHEFIIASHLVSPYYVSYWSALNYHGLTEQVPHTVFVATTTRLEGRSILGVNYRFIALGDRKFFGSQPERIGESRVNISDIEKTITDCLDHPEYCGGLDEVVNAMRGGWDRYSFEKLGSYSIRMGNSAVLKRLGFLAEYLNLGDTDSVDRILPLVKKGYSQLDPTAKHGGSYNARWRVQINVSENRLREWGAAR